MRIAGNEFDRSELAGAFGDLGTLIPFVVGSIFERPAAIHHLGWTTEETIIQEHGIGPLTVNYLNAAHHGRR